MATPIIVPKLGLTTDDVNIVEWKAKEGDRVEQGAIVVVLETQKVEWNVEAEASGFLHIITTEGNKAAIGAVIGLIAETKEECEKVGAEALPAPVPATSEPPEETEGVGTGPTHQAQTGEARRIRITPVARKMAEEMMVDITRIKGTGPGGRITREDVLRAVEEQKTQPQPTQTERPLLIQGKAVRESIPLRGMRKAIADHMTRSLAVSAQLSFLGEVDMSAVLKLRETFKKQEDPSVSKITVTEILAFAISRALTRHRDINCSIIDNELKIWEDINVGVAVALGTEGLVVPVVRHADIMSLTQVSQAIKELVEKARTGKLMPDDMSGGTFTLTSVGAIGVSWFQTPILNQPECAILGTGPITDKPVVRDGQIVIAPVMTFSLTCDHRAINGFGAEQFLRTLQNFLQTPGLLIL